MPTPTCSGESCGVIERLSWKSEADTKSFHSILNVLLMVALVWLKMFSFWPCRYDLKEQRTTGCVCLSSPNFRKGERSALRELTPGKYDEITIRH